ncbi:MAG: ParB/RepB/Spo0J family partition protein [Candidatus Omnitrophica bacterium]|nr:ParB/RepB/Spo0J family partition protein [Candidatus Omnitrophota bacterium]
MELKKRVLGKGLSALIPDTYIKIIETQKGAQKAEPEKLEAGIQEIPIASIKPNRQQPRHRFPEETITELANSIKEQGILQPVIVKKSGDGYELICGERRAKAAQKCGLDKIPAIVKDVAEDKLLEWALVENIQREDLNAIEEAQAYVRLIEERDLSQDEIAKRVGKDRSTVANTIRLLRLPQEILEGLIDGRLQAGHARALLALPTPEHQRQLAKRIMEERLSVRQVEEMVGRVMTRKRRAKTARPFDQNIIALETKLERKLGTQVRIFTTRKNQGKIEIRYYSLDDLDRLLNLLGILQS